MRFTFATQRAAPVCGETRSRRHGYRLRCLEPPGHDGDHRWTPELVSEHRGPKTRPPRRLGSVDRRVRSAVTGRRGQ
jgi:hypothetical protein